ncbi:rRNA-processing protein SAS10 [Rhodotorula paludigena]|uniref:rRNA-processing protein SAS10 n=1 Tax=Rhodotorula paludigena TaxID=86838 RepID=UPI00318066DC
MARPKQSGARKASNYRAKPIDNERAFDRSLSRTTKTYNTYEDTMDGDEDAFHLNRDKMLLDDYNDPATAGDHDGLDEPDTIYDLDLPSSDNDDEEEEEQDEPAPAAKRLPREFKSREKLAAKREDDRSRGRFGHEYDPKQDEVFGRSSDEEEDEDDDDEEVDAAQFGRDDLAGLSDDEGAPGGKEAADASDDEDEERWAAGHYHVSRRAPGEADSEDDEALELEEEEARRLQRRAREKMDGLDFGVDDDADEGEALGAAADAAGRRARIEDEAADEAGGGAAAESAAAGMGEAEAIAHLLKTQPETLALVDDFVLTASKIKQVETDLEVVRCGDGKGGEHPALAIMELEHQALTTYLPTLAFYFSLLLTPPSAPPVPRALLEKVLARLSSIRERLATMEELDLTSASYGAELDEEDEEDEDEAEEGVPRKRAAKRARDDSMLASEMLDFHSRLAAGGDDDDDSDLDLDAEEDDDDDEDGEEVTDSMLAGLDDDELEQIMAQLEPGQGAEELLERVRAKQREKAGLDALDDEGDEAGMLSEDGEEERRIAAARKAKKLAKKQGKSGAAAIPTLAPLSRTPPSSAAAAPRAAAAGSDLLDPLSLSASDRADKASSRHTLRFHVSQVAQKAAKRDARRRGLEGDDDVPRRSKEHARREVLKRQEHGAARDAHKGAGLDGDDFGEDDRRAARAVRGEADEMNGGDGDDGDDYYDLVAAEKEEGRRAKKARYDDARAAEKAEIEALSAASTDGPRGATRQILANKGLTPKRKKENRNARVKKRRQYDDKKKKLRSMKAHYGGGEARTGYEGERSGISRSTVKSVKLG